MNSLFSKICSIRVGIKLGGILIMLILLSSCKQDDVPEQESNLPDLDPTEDLCFSRLSAYKLGVYRD
ncbi:hypothetical protein [uncultured Bacteroides sp.]|uniref:hypothetical protein n=1 Tax=uncultured Bacteroides sp. TaxID=162156 RepID=UPI002607023D|nr:hypothetical protein [uncultured Bacteroides sp.]